MSTSAELDLAERIIALLSEGKFTATYKHAVLLALLDLCFEKTNQSGVPPSSVTTRELADEVLALYWPHCIPWEGGPCLRQVKTGQAEILTHIVEFRNMHPRAGSQPLPVMRREEPAAFGRLLNFVEWKLIQMPISKLQVLGRREDRFLFDYDGSRPHFSATFRHISTG